VVSGMGFTFGIALLSPFLSYMVLNLSFFSSRCETILENEEKVKRDMVTNLDATKISIPHTVEV